LRHALLSRRPHRLAPDRAPLNLILLVILASLGFQSPVARASTLRSSLGDPRIATHLRSALEWAARSESDPQDELRPTAAPQSELILSGPAYDWAGPDSRVLLVIEGNPHPGLLAAAGAEVNTIAGGVTTALAPLSRIPDILGVAGIRSIEMEQPLVLCTDVSALAINADDLWGGPPPAYSASGETGENVVVGIVDTGLDVYHEDFRTAAGSRVKACWDQTISTGTRPAGFTYGSEYSTSQINASQYPGTDDLGHGTHIAGVAAGNGRATGGAVPQFTFPGIAPEADLVFVKLTPSPNGSYTDARVIDGVNFVFQKAAALGKPAVVLLAVSKMTGPHDGSDAMDVALTALTGPGKLLVVAGGNEYGRSRHAEWTASSSQPSGNMTVNVPAYVASGNAGDHFQVEAWYDATENVTVTMTTPAGMVIGPVLRGTQITVQSPSGVVTIKNGVATSSNGSFKIEYSLSRGSLTFPALASGTWTVGLTALSNPYFRVDAWLTSWLLGSAAPTFVTGKTESRLIGSPATALGAVSASSYTTKRTWTDVNGSSRSYYYAVMNQIANYASSGPSRDGETLPHIAAPGYGVAGSMSSQALSSISSTYRLPDGVHYINSGTSVAAAHVAGGVALLLQSVSNLTRDQVVNQLTASATTDAFTGAVPNLRWGAGKLYLQPLAAAAVGDQVFTSRIGFNVTPNPSRGPAIFRFNVPLEMAERQSVDARLQIFDIAGREISHLIRAVPSGPAELAWDGSTGSGAVAAAGIYWGRLTLGGKSALTRIVRTR